MKNLTYIFLFCVTSVFAQIEVQNISQLTQHEQEQVMQYLESHDEVILTSPNTDTLLFEVINQYRVSKGLNKLGHSIRLDTLANLVIRHELRYDPVHYSQYTNTYRDLLSIENLRYGILFGSNFDRNDLIKHLTTFNHNFNPDNVLQGWIKSPGHHKNLLAEAEIGTAMVLMVIWKNDNRYDITHRAIYEADYKLSKRELDENVKKKNQQILQRKIVIKRS
ncbi:MAG: hypothetical protein KF763_13085 [Cyclobacteriaceae bacterium]|nr:hypothetical protein [Cyclobacteriaceae bacterium]